MPRVRDLTDAQREQTKAIADRHQPEIQPVMEQLRTAQAALDEAIVSNPSDEATIRLKSADVAAAEAELAVIRARIYSEVLTVLTPEQQQQLQEQRSRMRERLQSGPRQQAGR
jgi:Spy/CpxP family protein refolding chaperone